jgi:aspartokinase
MKANGFSGYFLARTDARCVVHLQQDVSIPSVFPHNRRPLITGALFGLLGREGMHLLGIASSPSALSVVIPSNETKALIDGLFEVFTFPDYGSPLEWHAAYTGKEDLFKDVVGSYEEEAIKVYAIQEEPGLDFWTVRLDRRSMERMGAALTRMDELQMEMPFFVAHSEQDGDLILGFCLAGSSGEGLREAIGALLPEGECWSEEAAGVFLHGPHFGDRYGIADAFAGSLQEAGIKPLALSCAVHSISAVFKLQDLRPAVLAISTMFHVPKAARQDRAPKGG